MNKMPTNKLLADLRFAHIAHSGLDLEEPAEIARDRDPNLEVIEIRHSGSLQFLTINTAPRHWGAGDYALLEIKVLWAPCAVHVRECRAFAAADQLCEFLDAYLANVGG